MRFKGENPGLNFLSSSRSSLTGGGPGSLSAIEDVMNVLNESVAQVGPPPPPNGLPMPPPAPAVAPAPPPMYPANFDELEEGAIVVQPSVMGTEALYQMREENGKLVARLWRIDGADDIEDSSDDECQEAESHNNESSPESEFSFAFNDGEVFGKEFHVYSEERLTQENAGELFKAFFASVKEGFEAIDLLNDACQAMKEELEKQYKSAKRWKKFTFRRLESDLEVEMVKLRNFYNYLERKVEPLNYIVDAAEDMFEGATNNAEMYSLLVLLRTKDAELKRRRHYLKTYLQMAEELRLKLGGKKV